MQVLAELFVGVAKSAKPIENGAAVEAFMKPFTTLWPDDNVLNHYVAIRCDLEAQGLRIGEADLWIAATARAHGDTVVTNNTREFTRVAGLKVEDWSI